ncbi:Na+/H+ antiporter NhaA [Planomonospora algeriensis]
MKRVIKTAVAVAALGLAAAICTPAQAQSIPSLGGQDATETVSMAIRGLAGGLTGGRLDGLAGAFGDPVVLGVVVGLVAGKPIGIMAATWLMARFTRADLDEDLAWVDVAGLSVLAGIGFTVSLLIGELAFGVGEDEHVKVAVLAGSLTAALLATVILRLRNRVYRRIREMETADLDHDGIPDVYETDRPGPGGG